MKSFTSNLRVVTIAFLALILVACQNEEIVPDVGFTDQDIGLKKPDKPQDPQLEYDVLLSTFNDGPEFIDGLPVNYLNADISCPGTAEGNNFGAMWRPQTCLGIFVDYGEDPQPHWVSKSPFIPISTKKGVIEKVTFSIMDLELSRLYATNPITAYGVPIQGEQFSVLITEENPVPIYVYSNPQGGKKTDIVAYIKLDEIIYIPRQ